MSTEKINCFNLSLKILYKVDNKTKTVKSTVIYKGWLYARLFPQLFTLFIEFSSTMEIIYKLNSDVPVNTLFIHLSLIL